MEKQICDLIEEITRQDGTIYYELGNIAHNSRAEYAAIHGQIKNVRILKMNIPRTKRVEIVEDYINEHYQPQALTAPSWEEWVKSPEIEKEMAQILLDNKLG